MCAVGATDYSMDRSLALESRTAQGTITWLGEFTGRGEALYVQAHYEFRVPDRADPFHHTDVMGVTDTSADIPVQGLTWDGYFKLSDSESEEEVRSRISAKPIEVSYLPENPWINEPRIQAEEDWERWSKLNNNSFAVALFLGMGSFLVALMTALKRKL